MEDSTEHSLAGFFPSVDAAGVNGVEGGSTVLLRCRVYDADTELTDPAVIESIMLERTACEDRRLPESR